MQVLSLKMLMLWKMITLLSKYSVFLKSFSPGVIGSDTLQFACVNLNTRYRNSSLTSVNVTELLFYFPVSVYSL